MIFVKVLLMLTITYLTTEAQDQGGAGFSIYGDPCPVELSQKTSVSCQGRRWKQLQEKKKLFTLAPIIPGEPIRVLNMSIEQQLAVFQKHPFEMWELNIYLTKTKGGGQILKQWAQMNAGQDIQSFADFVRIYAIFRKAQKAFGEQYFRTPTDDEPFKDIIKYWMQDKVFAEQRLAGINPMTIMRVVPERENVGMKWSELNRFLNQGYDWKSLIRNTPGMPRISMERAIRARMVFVLRYPLLDHIPAMPDIMESRPSREMWKPASPIALFAVHPRDRSNLIPLAIQMDIKPDSPVYTPRDKDLWMLAKLSLQGADMGYNQVAEHLAKTHLLLEPLCVSKDRQMSERHPLHQMIKYHCRGVSITDKLAFKLLLGKGESLHKLFPYGYLGAVSIALRSYRQTSWKDTDFLENIKKRGLEPRSLHYFPYRNDGYVLYRNIQRLAKDYVKQYYTCDDDVQKDYELQSFLNEVSSDGSGSEGGLGQVRDFPCQLSSVNSLVDFLTRFLWQISAHHAAVNYPMADYGAFTLNTPTKLYRDSRVADDVFSLFNFPNANISATQALIANGLSNYRFDSLFDYGPELPDKKGRDVVSKWFNYFQGRVQPYLEKRNMKRKKEDHLTYPYLLPRWIPNGIQT